MHVFETRTITKWGCQGQKFIVATLKIRVRVGSSDDKVIKELLVGSGCYQFPRFNPHPFIVEAGDVWLDIGGNIGVFALLVLSVGGTVVSVEPEKENVGLLRENLELNFPCDEYPDKYTVIEGGVAKGESGRDDFYLCKDTPNNRNIIDCYRHSMYQRSTHVRAVKVPVFSLADILRQHPDVNCIKIDGEGIEAPVVKNQFTPEVCKPIKKVVIEWSLPLRDARSGSLRPLVMLSAQPSVRARDSRYLTPKNELLMRTAAASPSVGRSEAAACSCAWGT